MCETCLIKVNAGECSKIFCPTPSCNCLVDGLTVAKLLGKATQRKYARFISDNFVTNNRLMKWCPAPDCPNAILVDSLEAKPTMCHCGHLFCFSCCDTWHAPVTCKLLKKWNKKCVDDSENANWIT